MYMTQLFQIPVLICFAALLTSCTPAEKGPSIKGIKITDLAPQHSQKNADSQLLKTINFNVFIFEAPAQNIDSLQKIYQALNTEKLRFNDYDAFGANSFSAGFGQIDTLNKIVDLLDQADAQKIRKVSLLLFDGHPDTITVTRLRRKKTIWYYPTAGSLNGIKLGRGTLAIQIEAEKIPSSKGVCNVNVQPIFSSPKSLIPESKSARISFTSTGFNLQMSPSDFFLLGPQKYISSQVTLDSLLFCDSEPKPVVRMFLFICTGIID